jgi:phosphatidate cytidylyltransferase
MTPMQKFLWLMAGIVGLLVLATLIGALLAQAARNESARAAVDNLNARTRSWWVMVAVFAAAYLLGSRVTLVLFALISFLALREFITLTPTKPGDHRALFVSFFIVVPVQYVLIGIDWYGLFSIFIPVYMFLLLPALSAMIGDTHEFLARNAKTQWGLMLTVYAISHAPALMMLRIPGYEGQGALLLFFLLAVVQISDVMQYVWGKLLGRHQLAPRVSPSKTSEGLILGGLSAIALGTGLWWITPFTPRQAALMSAIIVICGFLGGFVLSAVKRDLGAKDWGKMIEGHGGVLDRMDSITFAAPVFFHLIRYFYT